MNLYILMTALEMCGAICSIIILICVLIIRHSVIGRQQFTVLFLMMFMVNAMMLGTDALARSFDGVSGVLARNMVYIMNTVEYMSNQALQVFFTMYLAENFEHFISVKLWRVIAWCVSAAFFVLLIVNFFTGWVYYVDDANRYIRGRFYALNMLPALILQISNIWMIMKYRKRLAPVISYMGLAIAWVPVAAAILHVTSSQIPYIQLSCFALAVLVFINVQTVFAEMLQQQNRKEMQQEERMLVAQLQPHFLYNALLAIMGIEGNPPETVEALSSFSRYLRGTLNSLRQEDTIPAAQELKHVEAYVKLEQLRYGGKLKINLDLRENDFYLPPLSLEMLVENAIRHGFSGMDEPGTVSITSRLLEEWYMITVEDNGCGFDVDEILNSPGSHVGLQSVRRRIEDMCGGQLIIRSTKGVGTRASIMIPRYEVQELRHSQVMQHHLSSNRRKHNGKGGKQS